MKRPVFRPRVDALEDRTVPAGSDLFANATLIPGGVSPFTDSGSIVGATGETGEPNHAGVSTPLNSHWYSYTPTASGTVVISLAGSNYDTALAVYTGAAVDALTTVAANDDANGTLQSQVTFAAVAGTTYSIAIDGFTTATGTYQIALANSGIAPANDNFANATIIPSDTVTFTASGSIAGATGEVGEPNHANVSTPLNSVWLRYTATTSGAVQVSLAGSNYDTTLAVYTGAAVDALTTVAANDDANGTLQSALTFNAVAGTTYSIAVDGFITSTGNYAFRLTPAPANDNFANAIALQGDVVALATTGRNIGATAEAGEPNHAGVSTPLNSVWYTYTPTASGTVVINLAGSNYDTTLAVYTGAAVNALTQVAANDDAIGLQSQVTFAAVAGTTYRIAVDGFTGATGNIALLLTNSGITGSAAVNGTLFINDGATSAYVNITAVGASATGATGVRVQSVLGGRWSDVTYATPITAGVFTLGEGDDNLQMAESLTFRTTVNLGGGNNYALTGAGADTVTAGTGNDNINTRGGTDIVTDAGGNNFIDIGTGSGTVTAGAGDDQIRAANAVGSTVTVNAGNGNNGIELGDGTNSVTAGTGNDYVRTGNGNDVINVGAGSNTVFANGGNDRVTALGLLGTSNYISSGDGNDTVITGAGNDSVDLGAGDDIADLGAGDDYASGGLGNDVLLGRDGRDVLQGGDGSDLLVGGLGGDDLSGGNGNDALFAQELDVLGVLAENEGANLQARLNAWIASGFTTFDVTSLVGVNDPTPVFDNVRGDGGTDLFSGKDGSDYFDQLLDEPTLIL